MCGICAQLDFCEIPKPKSDDAKETKHVSFQEASMRIAHRGPDNTKIFPTVIGKNGVKLDMIFHRRSINGLSEIGDQPFVYDYKDGADHIQYHVMCNGELYFYRDLITQYNLTNPDGSKIDVEKISDCYVIGLLYHKIGVDALAKCLKGEYSFLIVEWKNNQFMQCIACRSRTGQKKLTWTRFGQKILFCSEKYGLVGIDGHTNPIVQVRPCTYLVIDTKGKVAYHTYHDFSAVQTKITEWDEAVARVSVGLFAAIERRLEMVENVCSMCTIKETKSCTECKERVGVLLSGGLDSSIVASVSAKIAAKHGKTIRTFSIGFKDSPDLLAAREVRKFIGSRHTEYVMTEKEMLEALLTTPFVTESYDITTNRASVWQNMLSWLIARDFPEIVVILGGDGADELHCGYRDCYRAPNAEAAHKHTLRRLSEIHFYDVTRFDLSVARCGQEARPPFLDDDYIDMVLSIDPTLRIPMEAKGGEFKGKMEKLLLREAFKKYLPDPYRRKEAFSDGVSLLDRSWFVILAEFFDKMISDAEFDECKTKYKYLPPTTKEAYFYRKQFESRFGPENVEDMPGFWLQEWCPEAKGNPSARATSVY